MGSAMRSATRPSPTSSRYGAMSDSSKWQPASAASRTEELRWSPVGTETAASLAHISSNVWRLLSGRSTIRIRFVLAQAAAIRRR